MDGRRVRSSKSLEKNPDVKLSKSLSWLLRHGAQKEGFVFEEGGFLSVEDVLKHKTFAKYTVDDVRRVVANDAKQRYTLRTSPADHLQIRANQGHSIEVQDLELVPVLDPSLIPDVIHGTYSDRLASIQSQGLSRMKRNHIHFFSAENVLSGYHGNSFKTKIVRFGRVVQEGRARPNCNVFIHIDAAKAMLDGFRFYRSSNGVILCPGNEQGLLPCKYFARIAHK